MVRHKLIDFINKNENTFAISGKKWHFLSHEDISQIFYGEHNYLTQRRACHVIHNFKMTQKRYEVIKVPRFGYMINKKAP